MAKRLSEEPAVPRWLRAVVPFVPHGTLAHASLARHDYWIGELRVALAVPPCSDATVLPRADHGPYMKVLLGIGGSEDSYTALMQVIERTRETGDELTVAVVKNPNNETTVSEIEAQIRETVAETGFVLSEPEETNEDKAHEDKAHKDEDVILRRVVGEPGPRLVEIAEREDFDRLVLGGGTRSPMGKLTLGKIAEYVLLNARVTVTLVR